MKVKAPNPPEFASDEWIDETELALAADVTQRTNLEVEINQLRLQYEEGLEARYRDDPSATGTPSPTTRLGQMHRTLASTEQRLETLTHEIVRRETLLQQAKYLHAERHTEGERKASLAILRQADDHIYDALTSLRDAWHTYRSALERVDRCATAQPEFHVYKDLSRLIADSLKAWGAERAYVTRLDAKTDDALNRVEGGLGGRPGAFGLTPDGFSPSAGWGRSAP